MKIQPYIDKLNSSNKYSDFMKKNSDSFLVAGFFVLDFETNNNLHQIDFYIPSQKKIAAFTLDKEVTFQTMDLLNDKIPEKLDITTNTDLDALKGILLDEMRNRNMTEDIKKIIAIIQNIEGKKVWNLNCVLSGMEILNAHVEDSSQMVLKMEKKSFVDIMKKMPNPQNNVSQLNKAQIKQPSVENIETEIRKLNQLEKAIEKEKKALKSEEAKLTKKNIKAKTGAKVKKSSGKSPKQKK